jgi:hypothetical protein
VIADDVLADFFEVLLQRMKPAMRPLLRALLSARAARQMNALVERAMKRSLLIE